MKRKTISMLLMAVVMISSLLIGCGNSKDVGAEKKTTEEIVETEKAEVKETIEETTIDKTTDRIEETEADSEETVGKVGDEMATVEEVIEEVPVKEIENRAVYEGIDMESTLPGEEWIETFVGVIDEAKLVVYNDSNNRKLILENYEEVEFAMDDVFVVYIPDGIDSVSYFDDRPFGEIIHADNAIIMKTVSQSYLFDGSIMLENVIKFRDGNYYTLTCTLLFTE